MENNKETLLQKALNVKDKRKKTIGSFEELELAVAYTQGVITARQAAIALGFKHPGNTTHRVTRLLRWGIENGKLKLELLESI